MDEKKIKKFNPGTRTNSHEDFPRLRGDLTSIQKDQLYITASFSQLKLYNGKPLPNVITETKKRGLVPFIKDGSRDIMIGEDILRLIHHTENLLPMDLWESTRLFEVWAKKLDVDPLEELKATTKNLINSNQVVKELSNNIQALRGLEKVTTKDVCSFPEHQKDLIDAVEAVFFDAVKDINAIGNIGTSKKYASINYKGDQLFFSIINGKLTISTAGVLPMEVPLVDKLKVVPHEYLPKPEPEDGVVLSKKSLKNLVKEMMKDVLTDGLRVGE